MEKQNLNNSQILQGIIWIGYFFTGMSFIITLITQSFWNLDYFMFAILLGAIDFYFSKIKNGGSVKY